MPSTWSRITIVNCTSGPQATSVLSDELAKPIESKGLIAFEYIDLVEMFCKDAGCGQSTNSRADDDCTPP